MAEDFIGGVLDEAWPPIAASLAGRPKPARPTLVVMVGIPFSGKSTLARALVARAPAAAARVENDAVRPIVARALGHDAPTYSGEENLLTYRAAWALLARALASGAHAVHDGTNLKESSRRGAYAVADAAGVPAALVFVLTPPDVAAARAAASTPDRQAAFANLGGKRPNPASASRPHAVVDGALPVDELVLRLADEPALASYFEAPPAP